MKMNREEFSEKIDITDSFLVYVTGGKEIQSSLVTVDATTSKVELKTEAPSISKKADKTTVEIGKVVKYTGVSADYLLFGKDTNNETIQKINNILTVNSAETSDFIYHIVMYSNDFCKKLNKEQKIDKI